MDMSGAPAIDIVAPGIGAGLHGAEVVVSGRIRQRAAAAAEIGIDRREIGVLLVPVASAGIGLPYLDERVGYRLAIAVEYVTVNDRLLADRLALFGIIEDEIVIERAEFVRRKYRAGYLR